MKLQEPYMFTGMQRDMSVSKQPAQFLYNGRNIRITSREGDTLLSITNEKSSANVLNITGDYLGHALLNQYLVVFCVVNDKRDLIYRIDLRSPTTSLTPLYDSDDHTDQDKEYRLYFKTSQPIEAIGSFENENVQKVYWTDNYNQPRMINIVAPSGTYTSASQFDFVSELNLNEKIIVKKLTNSYGTFASGVIQYAFTYYTKYGHESAVFYTTPLMYISPLDRGAAPDEKVDNAFEITIIGTEPSTSFDYLRIYSIQRTSLNGEAIVKRVRDIDLSSVSNNYIYYVDRGVDGEIIDPYSLFYKGGESIKAGTIEQKDNTLFLGNISFVRSNLLKEKKNIQSAVSIAQSTRTFVAQDHKLKGYGYGNQLSSLSNVNIDGTSYSQFSPCCGFKYDEKYRLGLQFQHKNGQWSMPIFKDDIASSNKPSISILGEITLPTFTGTLNNSDGIIKRLVSAGYRRVRGVVVFPNISDRNIVCQGVANPTLSTTNSTYVQSSWFFRPNFSTSEESDSSANTFSPWPTNSLQYADRNITDNIPKPGAGLFNPGRLRTVEVQGYYNSDNRFSINRSLCTIHSPEVDFDSQSYSLNYSSLHYRQVGQVSFTHTWSDILIQTETPTISGDGSGFIHKSFSDNMAKGIVSGLFYDDYIVNGNRGSEVSSNPFRSFLPQKASAKWLIYPWQKDGSLNNDIDRPTEGGVSSSVLKKKIISNLRYATTTWSDSVLPIENSKVFNKKPELFSSDEATIVKLDDTFYCGNIDTVLSPDDSDGVYFAWNGGYTTRSIDGIQQKDYTTPSDTQTPFNSTDWFKTFKYDDNNEYNGKHILYYNIGWFGYNSSDIATKYPDIAIKKGLVRMKYKSSPHLVGAFNSTSSGITEGKEYNLPVIEIVRTSVPNRFGGNNDDALQANVWIPCGEPVSLSDDQGNLKNSVTFDYSWGDTYFQRYDCLKTYPFTEDDVNQIVEIGSFMLETHVNIDGRYDKNRGQLSNLYMRPRNFNLINPVYSQLNNFFTYRIMDEKFYENNSFPNQITWTKEKQSGADVDLWTNITLASTYDMDGSKGGVVSLNTWKDNIYCFQKKGVSNILFNSRVQIPTSDGVPIEISNNYKVDGYRYLSDGIGCNSPRLIKETPTGIYFIDSVSNHLFQIGDGINNITQSHNMSSVFRGMVFDKVLYDDVNRDLYLVNNTEALCYSEVLGQFTGFMDYGGASLIESYDKKVFGLHNTTLYELFAGDGYCNLFGVNRPWGLTFVSNGTGNNTTTLDKTFTNLEFRASVGGDGEYDENTGKFTFTLPFDSLEVWDEHQHGKTVLKDVSNMAKPMGHFEDEGSSLRRKFRIWRCDIPRNNAPIESDEGLPNLFRKIRKPLDRMRNPWLYVKLQKDAATEGQLLEGTELHDLVMTYYS